jgi:hypothetical protein
MVQRYFSPEDWPSIILMCVLTNDEVQRCFLDFICYRADAGIIDQLGNLEICKEIGKSSARLLSNIAFLHRPTEFWYSAKSRLLYRVSQ